MDENVEKVVENVEKMVENEIQEEKLKVKDVAELQPYFKMLRLGVPGEAVKLKMSRENLNPALLDMPDANYDEING